MTSETTPDDAAAYLSAKGVLTSGESATETPLGGGVSNRVVRVTTETGCYVLKRPLANLDVDDDWPADLDRIHNEAAATSVYAGICEGIDHAHAPRVIEEFEADHAALFSCAPTDATMWKRDLLDGTVDPHVARVIGTVLGRVHADAAADEGIASEFEDKTPFRQLRVDPYHRTTARRHPDVADVIEREVDRLLSVDRTLVHGDYSPKNVLVTPDAPANVWILDFEVAHWGDPAFDTAFMLNHLFIKSIHNHPRQSAYLDAAERFWRTYRETVAWDVEAETVTELAVLMLARVDGKSPVEYVDRDDVADALRAVAKRALTAGVETVDGFARLVREESADL